MKVLLIAVAIVITVMSSPLFAGNSLRVSSPDLLAGAKGEEMRSLVREAYRRLGVDVTFVDLPTLRELEWTDLGEVDACLARTASVAKGYPNLVRVGFPLFHHSLVACGLARGPDIRGPADLRNLRVGASRGSLAALGYLLRLGLQPVVFNDFDAAFRALEEGRIDTAIGMRLLLQQATQAQAIPVRYSRPLADWNFYHWVNRGHADLAPRLAEVLRAMYEEGATARLLGEYAWMLDGLDTGKDASAPVRAAVGDQRG